MMPGVQRCVLGRFWFALFGTLILLGAAAASAHAAPVERTFQAPRSSVEKALKQLQPATSGRLPTLDGFALQGEHPLNNYERAFFQCTIQVNSTSAGESVVLVSAKLTAWYKGATASQSGYQLLQSNGRIEADLLEQLADQLSAGVPAVPSPASPSNRKDLDLPPAPGALAKPGVPDTRVLDAPKLAPVWSKPPASQPASGNGRPDGRPDASLQGLQPAAPKTSGKTAADLQAETASLEDVLKNQARPKNIVAVKKSGTPVVSSPSLTASALFLATAHDEFELLDYGADWAHVRISGLSRGWIWRTSLEMPEGIPDVAPQDAKSPPAPSELFQVSREETGPFPGDWEPLRGKNVRIISVQKVREEEQGAGATAKLEFAKTLLDQNYDLLAKSSDISGLVLVFDSADGGMVAATIGTIARWKAGALNDAALWHRCYFDPPETFSLSPAGSR